MSAGQNDHHMSEARRLINLANAGDEEALRVLRDPLERPREEMGPATLLLSNVVDAVADRIAGREPSAREGVEELLDEAGEYMVACLEDGEPAALAAATAFLVERVAEGEPEALEALYRASGVEGERS